MAKTYGNFTDFIDFSRSSSATYLDSDGLIKTASDDIPRIEYDANGVVKGLLIEEARTNLVTYSEDFSQGSWTKVESSISPNVATAPDGTLTADKLVPSTNFATNHLVRDNVTLSAKKYTLSVYAKANGYNWIYLTLANGSGNAACYFNLSTGEIGSTPVGTPSIQNVGDGWFKCSVSTTVDAVAGNHNQFVYVSEKDNDSGFTGDGTSGVYIWGAQIEEGTFPTSYIPTSGAAATRSADIADIATANFGYNPKAGTVVVECLSNSGEYGERAISLSDGTATNQNWLQISGGGSFVGNVYTSGAYVTQLDNTTSTVDGFTAALAFKDNSFGLSVDGGSAVSDSAGNIAVYSDLHIGRRHDGLSSTVFNGHIRSIKYLPRRLSNAQLQEQTA